MKPRLNFLRRLSRRQWFYSLLLGTPALAAAHAAWVEPNWLACRRHKLAKGQPTHRLVHFTDLHHKGNRKFLERVVSQINALKPDSVCFTGDLVEEEAHLAEALEVLRGLRAPAYGVAGNHDHWANLDFEEVRRSFSEGGGTWLNDNAVKTRDGKVNMIGLSCLKEPDATPDPQTLNVVLMHYPAWVKRLAGGRFDLLLAGHSHGGQVRLPFLGALVLPWGVDEFDLGMFRTPAGPLYVGAGVGWFFLPFRFRCRPEITLFEL